MQNLRDLLAKATFLCSLSQYVVLATYFGITSETYRAMLVYDAPMALINMGRRSTEAAKNRARMTCARRCAHHPQCKAQHIDDYGGYLLCFLHRTSKCQGGLLYSTYAWLTLYDMIPDAGPPLTCLAQCVQNNNGNCAACDRPGCVGNDCQICSRNCRDCFQNFPGDTNCVLRLSMGGSQVSSPLKEICVGEKMLMYRRFSYPNGTTTELAANRTFAWGPTRTAFSDNSRKYMYIELFSLNGLVYTALYSGFKCEIDKSLTLGSFVNGTAGNGLQAPLMKIPIIETLGLFDPACGMFWNLPKINNSSYPKPFNATGPCPGGMTAFFGKPNNTGGVFYSGISWSTLPNNQWIGIQVYLI